MLSFSLLKTLIPSLRFREECFCGNEEPSSGSLLPESSCDYKCPANKSQSCGSYLAINILETGVASKFFSKVGLVYIN